MNGFDLKGHMQIMDGMRYYKKTEEQNNMICYKITLKEPVDPECLKYAAEAAFKRIRVFRLAVKNDGKKFYLVENNENVVVHHNHSGIRRTVCTEENNGYMTRIGYDDKTITIDFFHGVSDGMGIIAFQKTLLHYYVSKKYDITPQPPFGVLLADTPEEPFEYADSLSFIGKEAVQPPAGYKYERALQIVDEQMDSPIDCKRYDLTVDAKSFDSYMRAAGSSRSGMFAMFMNRVIYEVNENAGKFPVVAAMAADARAAYGAEKTLQCCVTTVPVWYDEDIRRLPWDGQLKKAREMVLAGVDRKRVLAGAQGLIKFNQALEMQYETLEEKKAYAKSINKKGSAKYTYGISYLGEIDFGPDINKYVESSFPILSANTIPIIIEITKFRDKYHINYCTHIEEDPYIQRLQELLENEGLPCSCSEPEIFTEAYADF